jgi:hypothetical protein
MERVKSRDQLTERSAQRTASDASVNTVNPAWATYLQMGYDDGDKIDERRKSIEVSSIRVNIDRTELSRSSVDSTTYTNFCITVSSAAHSWVVRRRYSGILCLIVHLIYQD